MMIHVGTTAQRPHQRNRYVQHNTRQLEIYDGTSSNAGADLQLSQIVQW